MPTRRYGDEEVREIFSLASTDEARDELRSATEGDEPNQLLPAEQGGFTLDELQQIGREAGIEPARIAHAAASLDAREQPVAVRRALGMPVGVSRVVALPRAPTDREWEHLITRFRTTFGVQGEATSSGSMRDWSHGNLHIAVEPTEHGTQLRLSTRNEGALALNGVGFVTGGMSILMGAVVASAGKPDKALVIVGMFGGIALASFGANLLRLPRWSRERGQQFELLGAHAVQMLNEHAADDTIR